MGKMNFKTLTLAAISARLEDTLVEDITLEGDPGLEITGMARLEDAEAGQLSFLSNPRYTRALAETKASAVIVPPAAERPRNGASLLRTQTPYLAFAHALTLLIEPPHREPGVHPGAHVHETARVADSATVMPGAYVGAGAAIGAGTVLLPGAVVMGGCTAGSDCLLHITGWPCHPAR